MSEGTEGNQAGPGNTCLITCVVQRGNGDAVSKAALKAKAGGATTFFARGAGNRQMLGLLGLAIVPEKEVVMILCKVEDSSRIFDAVAAAGKLDTPGMGVAYMIPILQVRGGNF